MRSKGIKTPALVVALGTTASKSAMELCEHLLSMEQDDRDAVAIVTIDTDTARPDFRNLLESHPGKFHAFHAPIRVPANVDQADALPRAERRQVFMPRYTPHYYDYGAGGIRNHGHVALSYRLDEVYSAFQDALASIKLLQSGQGHHVTDSVQVYVVAFLGGGTGSGIVADIGVILRDMLATELQGQRLLLFGILPSDRMPGAGSNEESWRKSNATAAILEIMATGMAARGAQDRTYRKRLLNRTYKIPEGPIFNEVYLIGRTNLNDVDRVAHMAGLDLFQRITDASGVGDRERSQSPDFKDLKGKDDRELYTNFSASCPIEIRFPALEVADAFASLAAGRLLQLPDFVGEVPPESAPTIERQEEWEQAWDTYAKPAQGATDDSPLVPPLLSFQASQFIGTGSTRRNILWSQLEEFVRRIPTQLERKRQIILKRETDRLDKIPDAQEGDTSSFTARRLNHLSQLRQEYAYALDLFDKFPQEPPSEGRDYHLESRLDNMGVLGVIGPVRDNMEQARAQQVALFYNRVIEDAFYYQRHQMLSNLLSRLKQRADDMYEGGTRDVKDARPQAAAEEYIRRGLNSQIWRGRLGKEHPHQIGLFEIDRFQRTQQARDLPMMPAMVGLFRWATAAKDEGALGDCASLDITSFDAELRADRWMGDCIRYLNKARRQDAAALDGARLSEADRRDALAVDAGRLPERVLEFFRERYRALFADENLFDLLSIGYAAETNRSRGAAWREVPELMRSHLIHASNILREMVGSDPSLWRQGADSVRPTLYLGVNWREGTQEKGWVEELARVVTFRGLDSPKLDRDNDPHRMQLNFALHAISIRTIPMFFMRNNSLTSEYLRYEYSWLGGWRPGAGQGMSQGLAGNGAQTQSGYGSGGLPVHSCEEMERLTLDKSALPNRWDLNLVQRVLRETSDVPQEPDWTSLDPEDDDPFGRPGGSGGYDNGGRGGGRGDGRSGPGGSYGGGQWGGPGRDLG